MSHDSIIEDVMAEVDERNPHEPEFLQAVREVVESVAMAIERHPEYHKSRILRRLIEPERVIQFRVPWIDDDGDVQINRGWRVQFSSTLGPYKGGLRFHRSVNLSILKFLGFEQVFKNGLTMLPIGAGKGGSNFDPRGRSNEEIMRFCQSFMSELFRHIGPDTDVPAGDIGVGVREIGYLFGQYKRLANEFTGAITGKRQAWGGSHIRLEATGYGLIYFAAAMLSEANRSFKGKRCIISGSGNVAQYAAEKIIEMGGKVVTMSDSAGFIVDGDGIDREKLNWILELKNERRERIEAYTEKYSSANYTARETGSASNPMWEVEAECAFPCATENEINEQDAKHLVDNGVELVCEGANMPCTSNAMDVLEDSDVLYGPGKAANAGGVAVSALEMAQNSIRFSWPREEVDERLRQIMQSIHDACRDAAESYDVSGHYVHGANLAGFEKVADAMLEQGLV